MEFYKKKNFTKRSYDYPEPLFVWEGNTHKIEKFRPISLVKLDTKYINKIFANGVE